MKRPTKRSQRIAAAEAQGYERQGSMNAWREPGARGRVVFEDELPSIKRPAKVAPRQYVLSIYPKAKCVWSPGWSKWRIEHCTARNTVGFTRRHAWREAADSLVIT